MTAWTKPEQIVTNLRRRWQRGEILAPYVGGESVPCIYPLEIPLRRPTARETTEQFGAVMSWVDVLRQGSREVRGRGYGLRWKRLGNRVQGANELPVAATIADESDVLFLLREQAAAQRFRTLTDETLARHPALAPWLRQRCMRALPYAADWSQLLDILDFFVARRHQQLYLRQLDIPGVDTKFIEARRGIIIELLNAVLPEPQVNSAATGAANFALRYGLKTEPTLVRFRLLDSAINFHGLSDLSVPAEEFAQLSLPVTRVFITENRINGLAMPDCPASLVIFGLGYGLERLAQAPWLKRCDVWYWGDIDTHGFGILNRLRALLPHARSLLMDRATLLAHRELWGQEPVDRHYSGEPTHLTVDERNLLDELRADSLGERVRLEQERIGFRRVVRTVTSTTNNARSRAPSSTDATP